MTITNKSGTFEQLTTKCPHCGLPLFGCKSFSNQFAMVYCPHGKCDNELCNIGALGDSINDAINQLTSAYEATYGLASLTTA